MTLEQAENLQREMHRSTWIDGREWCSRSFGNAEWLRHEAGCCRIEERHCVCAVCGKLKSIGDWDRPPIAEFTLKAVTHGR